jgi:hypothetical protein
LELSPPDIPDLLEAKPSYPPSYLKWWVRFPRSKRKRNQKGCFVDWNNWRKRVGEPMLDKAVENYRLEVGEESDYAMAPERFLNPGNSFVEEYANGKAGSNTPRRNDGRIHIQDPGEALSAEGINPHLAGLTGPFDDG